MKKETISIHGGYETEPTTKSVAVPIYQTVAYEFDNAQHGADLFNLEVAGNIYSRIMNPTVGVLEERIAALEGGVAALCVSAGSAAINYAILNIAEAGDNIISTPQLYGGTYTLFAHMLPKQGIEVRFAESDKPEDIAKLIDGKTKAVYCESIGNPAGNIVDLAAIAKVSKENGVPLIVDNTVASPVLINPIEHGADIVVHSMTKYIGGHGTTMGGVLVDGGTFDWVKHKDKFPMLNEPEPSYHGVIYTEAFGAAAYIGRVRTVALRNTGSALSAMAAWQILQGLETLSLRMERHCENAISVAKFLENHEDVSWVNYGGLEKSEFNVLAKKYCDGKPSSLMTFGIKGGFEKAEKFYDSLNLFKRLVNIGDAKSLACHPASTTHRQMSKEEQQNAGVSEDLLRLCVGIEHIDDIIEDLNQAFVAAK
ncbi:O-acetylhomoserine aminocarboxypropyltransferase/cysteine synthase [Flavobacteriales bacterium]|jgi:O-acetylhomoserine (thiol)-lyase|nr:O-acetylhomoserine aminocarboxypropyltransferase/cysteine synthase [Flavobacteriales bacterium]